MPKKNRQSVFRELESQREITIQFLNDNVFASDHRLHRAKYNGIMELHDFVYSYSWVKSEETKERLKYYFERADLNAIKTADHFTIPVEKVWSSIKYYSDILYDIVGASLKAIVQSENIEGVEDALLKFRRLAQKKVNLEDYFLAPSLFPEPKFDYGIKLEDCSEELKFLRTLTESCVKDYLANNFDTQRISHILAILTDKTGVAREWNGLKKLFEGQFSLSAEGDPLDVEHQVAQMQSWVSRQNLYVRSGGDFTE
ncbi:hypothetical protein [Paenibacillus sp. 32352]|uniref:hypothetical protein n=1 Tax=Paenibacillus sp. 32352 TaxID=1969111 RepID=UPI0009AD90FA|nr:hypothetical protein [Paenibacillus sp. 32352]